MCRSLLFVRKGSVFLDRGGPFPPRSTGEARGSLTPPLGLPPLAALGSEATQIVQRKWLGFPKSISEKESKPTTLFQLHDLGSTRSFRRGPSKRSSG